MLRVDSPWIILIPTCALGVMTSTYIYDALTLEDQSVHKFATHLIKTFKPQMPSSCWKKKDDLEVINCFFEKGEDPIFISRKAAKSIARAFKEFNDQRRMACECKTAAATCFILSIIGLYYSLLR
jgi:hypothetical protein